VRAGLAAAFSGAMLAAGCGGSARAPADNPNGGRGLHGAMRLADCSDWNRGPEAQRVVTLGQLSGFYGGVVGSGNAGERTGRGKILHDDRARQLFARFCSRPFASAFKLYKLYGRAAAFEGSAPP